MAEGPHPHQLAFGFDEAHPFEVVRVLSNPYYTVDIYVDEERIDARRSERSFTSRSEILRSAESLLAAIEKADANHFALLLDARNAPTPSDPKYEKANIKAAWHLCSRFDHVAIVLESIDAIEKAKASVPTGVHLFTNPVGARRALLALQGKEKERPVEAEPLRPRGRIIVA